MTMLEIADRDGLARITRFTTPHGAVETPVLLPVIHPDKGRQTISPSEMSQTFGVRALITSSYITFRDPAARERATTSGLHRLLDFPGTIMTDSGAFQQHVYGDVHVTPEEILTFQNAIGTDIATPLDIFIEPDSSFENAKRGVEETVERVKAARIRRGEGLLAVPIQGGMYKELRTSSLTKSSEFSDILCVGGIVPLMEKYRFADVVRILSWIRPDLPPEKPLHLFGLGHPMFFALGALLGGDIFDTSSYNKFARRGALMFPYGTVTLESVKEDFCPCFLCKEVPLTKVKELSDIQREAHLSRHNLLQCMTEIARVKQAIHEGEIWDLAERRASAHPRMDLAMREALSSPDTFTPTEPASRENFSLITSYSLQRPSIVLFRERLSQYVAGKGKARLTPLQRLTSNSLRRAPDPDGSNLWVVNTPVGDVPLELIELYPVGAMTTPDGSMEGYPEGTGEPGTEKDANMWALRHSLGIIEWCWGESARHRFSEMKLEMRHSRRSGRLREILEAGHPLFVVGNDGLPRPTFAGGEILNALDIDMPLRVTANEDAVPFVSRGYSLFSKHVKSSDPGIRPGYSVIVSDDHGDLISVGRSLLSSSEMGRITRGVAVATVSHRKQQGSDS